jgi:hypothetical protein
MSASFHDERIGRFNDAVKSCSSVGGDGKRIGGDLVSVEAPSSAIDLIVDKTKFLLANNQFPVCGGKADLCAIKDQDGNFVCEVPANT